MKGRWIAGLAGSLLVLLLVASSSQSAVGAELTRTGMVTLNADTYREVATFVTEKQASAYFGLYVMYSTASMDLFLLDDQQFESFKRWENPTWDPGCHLAGQVVNETVSLRDGTRYHMVIDNTDRVTPGTHQMERAVYGLNAENAHEAFVEMLPALIIVSVVVIAAIAAVLSFVLWRHRPKR